MMLSRAMIASALVLGTLAGAEAAPAPFATLSAQPAARAAITPVFYRCIVPVCGPYRCAWVNRCRRPWWW